MSKSADLEFNLARLSGVAFLLPASGAYPSDERDDAMPAAMRRLRAARTKTAPADLAAAAQFALISGEPRVAEVLLKKAVATAPAQATLFADLAATYLTLANREGDGHVLFLTRAMDAAGRATSIDPGLAQGWFNLAIALETLGLKQDALQAWQQADVNEGDSRWRHEARRRAGLTLAAVDTGWSTMRVRLLESQELEATEAARAAATYPQPVRELLEEDLLFDWATAHVAGYASHAAISMRKARILNEALRELTQDRLLSETLDALKSDVGSLTDTVAAGIVAFARGRRAYENNQFEQAGAAFANAIEALRRANSPFVELVRYHSAIVGYQQRRLIEAKTVLQGVLAKAAARRFAALAARAELLLGMVRLQTEDLERALVHYRTAEDGFRILRETENVANAANAAADTLRLIGQHEAGWPQIGTALAALPQLRSARRRYVVLLNASLYAADDDLPMAALLFQNASIAAARERGTPNTLAEGYTRRAALHLHAENLQGASSDLAAAEAQISRITSEASRTYQLAWLQAIRGDYLTRVDPRAALADLDAALTYFTRAEPAEIPRAYLRQSRAYRALGDDDAAERSLREGIRHFDSRWEALEGTTHRVSYLDEAWDLFDDIVELYAIRRAQPGQAFAYCESSRARSLRSHLAPAAMVSPLALQNALGPDTAILYFATLKHRLLVWTITSTSVRFAVREIPESDLAARVGAYRGMLEAGQPSAEVRSLATGLYDQLIRPAMDSVRSASTLVVIPDGALHAVPFATLVDARTGRYLVEQYAVGMAPSASAFLRSSTRMAQLAGQRPTLLAVGNSAPRPGQGLPALAYAGLEVREVASLYSQASVLLDANATVEAFRRLAPTTSVLHFAGHARANLRFPDRSELFLTPSLAAPDGVLHSRAVQEWPLKNTALVVLGACETAHGPLYRGEGIVSLAHPFLSAGVSSVVGTLWKVDDRSTRQLLRDFHEQYLLTHDPVVALRRAQLSLLQSRDTQLAQPTVWGAFAVISGRPPGA